MIRFWRIFWALRSQALNAYVFGGRSEDNLSTQTALAAREGDRAAQLREKLINRVLGPDKETGLPHCLAEAIQSHERQEEQVRRFNALRDRGLI